jgi:hypothetical protein
MKSRYALAALVSLHPSTIAAVYVLLCLQDCALLQQGVPAGASQGPQASLQEDHRTALSRHEQPLSGSAAD